MRRSFVPAARVREPRAGEDGVRSPAFLLRPRPPARAALARGAGIAVRILAALAAAALPAAVLAGVSTTNTLQEQLVLGTSSAKELFGWLRTLGILVGLFGFLGIAFSGYTGRFNFKWMLTIGGAMIVLGIAGVLVDFFVKADGLGGTGADDFAKGLLK